jgi:glycosyltransferase involved in cell wall biosynthesis
VRTPVQTTQMGRIVPPRNAEALAEAVVDVILNRQNYVKPRSEIESHFPFEQLVQRYENLLQGLL